MNFASRQILHLNDAPRAKASTSSYGLLPYELQSRQVLALILIRPMANPHTHGTSSAAQEHATAVYAPELSEEDEIVANLSNNTDTSPYGLTVSL